MGFTLDQVERWVQEDVELKRMSCYGGFHVLEYFSVWKILGWGACLVGENFMSGRMSIRIGSIFVADSKIIDINLLINQ